MSAAGGAGGAPGAGGTAGTGGAVSLTTGGASSTGGTAGAGGATPCVCPPCYLPTHSAAGACVCRFLGCP